MQRGPAFDAMVSAQHPRLMAIAMILCRDFPRAQDLVQDTMVKALASPHLFSEGTNFNAWLSTILRNTYITQARVAAREVQDVDGLVASSVATAAAQIPTLEFHEAAAILETMAVDQRQALMLVGAHGYAYEDAAILAGVPVGTMKSRVSRARDTLAQRMGAA